MAKKAVAKSSSAEIELRVSEVKSLILSGHTRADIVRHGSKKWDITTRQVDDYMAWAKEEFEEHNRETLKDNLARAKAVLWGLFKEADSVAVKHQVFLSLAKLQGLDPNVINHVIEDKRKLAELPLEEVESLLLEAEGDEV